MIFWLKWISILVGVSFGLWLLWQMSQNGRYQGIVKLGSSVLIIVDTRTGDWVRTDVDRSEGRVER
jgi:hypothetical protein